MPKHYKHFASRQNMMNKPFNLPLYPEDIRELTKEDFFRIKEVLACYLSPETLHCDGEATQEEVDESLEHYLMLCREISVNTSFNLDINEIMEMC